MSSLLRLDPAPPQPKNSTKKQGPKGLSAANADTDDILDAILPAKQDGKHILRVSSTPATKMDVVALQVSTFFFFRTTVSFRYLILLNRIDGNYHSIHDISCIYYVGMNINS